MDDRNIWAGFSWLPHILFWSIRLWLKQNFTASISFEKISDSTNIKISERIGVYYNKDKSHSITISSDKILWSYFSDANINIDDMNSEEAVFSEIKNYIRF